MIRPPYRLPQETELSFRQLLFRLSLRLRLEDARNLRYLCQLPPLVSTNRSTFSGTTEQMNVLIQLERFGIFSQYNLDGLVSALEKIQRRDLVEMVRRWIVEEAGQGHYRRSRVPLATEG